jgi:hypothetical protein
MEGIFKYAGHQAEFTPAQSALATLPKLPPGLVVAAAQGKDLAARLEAHAAVRLRLGFVEDQGHCEG